MAVSKVIFGNTTVMDITDSTVSASKLKSGETAYGADGTKITGSLVVPEVLDDLSDVVITSPQTAQEIYYDGTEWINYGAKIILTFDDDFKGQIITLTKGQTTITKTAPLDSNTMNLYVNETGTWTISSEISETIYETEVNVTTFGTSFDAELNSVPPVPQGSTVTPTDDIQTWLHCANIWDKSYTTLAEVLADRSTFETLIADSNACDYMARSTTWAVQSGQIPTMTSNTTPSGTASANVIYGTGYEAWRAFNVSETNGWIARNTTLYATGDWLEYDFDTDVTIGKVSVGWKNSGSANSGITYKIQEYNGSTWEDVSTEQSISFVANTIVWNDILLTTSSNRKHRLYITSVVGSNANGYGFKMQFYTDADITTSQDAMALIGKYDYCSNALLSNATWAEAIANSDYFEYVSTGSVPKMTSNTTPSGIASADTVYQSQLAYLAFDRNESTYWDSTNTAFPHYIGYKYATPICVKAIRFKANIVNTSLGIKNFEVRASNDDFSTYVVLLSETAEDVATYQTFTFNNTTKYTSYRLHVIDKYETAYNYCAFTELQFYGRASSEVLVPLVPTMTSNTTPSGVASANISPSGFEPYKAFDKNTSTRWASSSGNGSWLEYDFGATKTVKAFSVYPLYHSSNTLLLKSYKIQGSNDNFSSDINDLYEETLSNTNVGVVQRNFTNVANYRYYRLLATSNSYYSSGDIGILELQFYDRTVQTNIIHSCANDTIYYMDEGSPVIVATTNSDGDGVLDFSSLEDKEYTFYSSVAKDPSNLSNDFSKTIRITKSEFGGTTEMYLMPDAVKTLYWWGYESDNLEDCTSANGWSLTNYTLDTPTHNANNILLSSSSMHRCAIANKNLISANKIITIVTGISNYQTYGYGSIRTYQSKSYGSQSGQVNISSSSIVKVESSFTQVNCYACTVCDNGQSSRVHALWYE